MIKATLLVCTAISGLVLSSSATAQTASQNSVFDFIGQCSDCTGYGTGVLVLNGYTPYTSGQTPTSFDASNFVSFTYNSDLIQFSLDRSTNGTFPLYVEGSIGTAPGYYPVTIQGLDPDFNDFDSFQSKSDGTWSVTKNQVTFDMGTLGTWNVVASGAIGAVPEPATWGMMILGFGAVGFAMRRRVRASEVKFA